MPFKCYGFCNQCANSLWREPKGGYTDFEGMEKGNVHCISCYSHSVDTLGNCNDTGCLYFHGTSKWEKLRKRIERFLGL